jgi:putative ABC transport system permease protein
VTVPVAAASTGTVAPDWRLAVVLVALVAVAVAASVVGRLGVERTQVVAAVRAVVQLGLVSLVIAAALASVWWSLAFVLLMFSVATLTSTGRIGTPRDQLPWVALAIACGVAPVLGLIFASGVVPFTGPGIIPIAGIVVGNMMTAATLTGRRAYDEIAGKFGTYEAGLALGMTSPEAAFEVVQPTAK